MNTPWIDVVEHQDQEDQAGPGFPEYLWQARFACQVGIRSHEEWVKLKWGFNASALFEETLERQRLFLESQHIGRDAAGTEHPNHRTLAFRYLHRSEEELELSLLGKIQARTKEAALEEATAFFREIKATFPYDYHLAPARSREEFLLFSGEEILSHRGAPGDLIQIRRQEIPLLPEGRSPCLQGFWQSNARAHEQVWRTLAASPGPLLLNIAVRSTILYPRELEILSQIAREISSSESNAPNRETFQARKQWNELYAQRRLAPWQKFFYTQIHLASTCRIDESLCRVTGTSLTLKSEKYASLGYQVIQPEPDSRADWRRKVGNLDLIFSPNQLLIQRLADVADLEELFAVVRLPYAPPENGFPDMKFAAARDS